MAFCFHKYGPLQKVSCGQLHCFDVVEIKIGPNHENSVPCGSLSHFLVLDRFEGLIL